MAQRKRKEGPHAIHRLSAMWIAKKSKPGTYADGGGLWLQITEGGSKSWSFRFMLNRRAREMGLGPLHAIDLATAREKARACRALLVDGIDPIEHRKSEIATRAVQTASAKTFDWCRDQCIEAMRPGWKNAKHAAQWLNTLATYASPKIGKLPVNQLTTDHMLEVLKPIWATKTETATRVRARLESVLDWATAAKHRTGDNPARWQGLLEHMLTDPAKLKDVEHQPALDWRLIPLFVPALQRQEGNAARALELLILGALRTTPVLLGAFSQVDFKDRIWTVPAANMKLAKDQDQRDHLVPLTDRMIEILVALKAEAKSDLFFTTPGTTDTPMSNAAMLALLKRMHGKDSRWVDPVNGRRVVPHGFRSSFSDWASESTDYPAEVREMALAHTIKNKSEAAYRRGDLLEKRRRLMDDWARYCASAVELRLAA